MKVNNEFLTAKKDKAVQSLLVRQDDNKQYMYLCIDAKIPYTDKKETVFIETNTELRIENYSGSYSELKTDRKVINAICFHCTIYGENFVQTFLKAIKKDSDVSFKVVAYNSTDSYIRLGIVAHQLYGYIDNKEYFLSCFVGLDNTGSPVKSN